MTRIGFALSLALLVAVAAWSYHVNYRTAAAMSDLRDIRRAIAAETERIAVLEVEWAVLTAPDRLRRLVAAHNDRLLLMPVAADHFGDAAMVPFPPRPELETPGLPIEPAPPALADAGPEEGFTDVPVAVPSPTRRPAAFADPGSAGVVALDDPFGPAAPLFAPLSSISAMPSGSGGRP